MNRYRWAWFALACLVVAGWAWTSRYEYRECNRGGCIAVNRWTGEHHRTDEAGEAGRRRNAEQEEWSRDSLAALGIDTMSGPAAPAPGVEPGEGRWSKYSDQEKIRRFREAHGLDTASLSADTASALVGGDTVFGLVAEPGEP